MPSVRQRNAFCTGVRLRLALAKIIITCMHSINNKVVSNGGNVNAPSKEPFFKFNQNMAESKPFFEGSHINATHTDGPPDVQRQQDGGAPPPRPATPCPTSVSIGALAPFNHSNLSTAEKEAHGTYLGIVSKMNVGPGPDHSGHCMKESLTNVSNTCPAQVYSRGATPSQPCTGNRCLDINSHASAGDAATHSMLSDGPASFIDLHRTHNTRSLLDGSGVSSCSVVCDQVYSCDRTQATTGRFRITRNYQAGTHTRQDGTIMPITTGSVTKVAMP